MNPDYYFFVTGLCPYAVDIAILFSVLIVTVPVITALMARVFHQEKLSGFRKRSARCSAHTTTIHRDSRHIFQRNCLCGLGTSIQKSETNFIRQQLHVHYSISDNADGICPCGRKTGFANNSGQCGHFNRSAHFQFWR